MSVILWRWVYVVYVLLQYKLNGRWQEKIDWNIYIDKVYFVV